MLKLDEDMSDPDMDALSDSSSSDDDIFVKPRARAPESSTPPHTYSASFPRSTLPRTAPMTIPERKQPQFRSRRKRIGTYHGQTTSYRASMRAPAATSYKESYSFSSDSELDDR